MLVLKLISNLYIYLYKRKHFFYINHMRKNMLKLNDSKTRFVLLFLLIAINSFSQTFFKYKISKPYCVFNFMETSIGSHGTSITLEEFIQENTKNDIEFLHYFFFCCFKNFFSNNCLFRRLNLSIKTIPSR